MEFFFGYSPWFIIVCVILAAGLSYFLYRLKKEEEDVLPGKWRQILRVFRFVVLFVLSVLLLEPLLKTLNTKVEKPIVVIAADQSQSVALTRDSAYYRKELQRDIESLSRELGDAYQVEMIGFGATTFSDPDFTFTEKVTDISAAVEDVAIKYGSGNLGAVILASDGIINRGNNPLYNIDQLRAPFYTIALGDSTPKTDAAIKNLKTNKVAFLGNQFPVVVEVKADKLQGKTAQLSIVKNGRTLAVKNFVITAEAFVSEFSFLLTAEGKGIQGYTVLLTTFPGEVSESNNRQQFFIEVIENRQKILIAYSHPHPDVAALRKAIEINGNYEADALEMSVLPVNLSMYDLVIFHQAGGMDGTQRTNWDNLQKSGKPQLLCLGSNSDWGFLNSANLGIRVNATNNQNLVQGKLNEAFQLFSYSGYTQAELADLPPLSVPFGEYNTSPAIIPVLTQQLDKLSTALPLVAFSEATGTRKGFVLGEGLWRWRMATYAKFQSHEKFDQLIGKAVQYLTANANRKNFVVNYKKQLDENEDAVITAELYNAAFEFVQGADIQFNLVKEDSIRYEYAFNKGDRTYDLNLKSLPSGQYSFTAITELAGKKLTETGSFVVSSLQLEAASIVADHNLLFQMANNTGGKMVYPRDMSKLAGMIKNNPTVKPVSYSSASLSDAIRLKWLFFLLVSLLAVEWFVRKRNGLY